MRLCEWTPSCGLWAQWRLIYNFNTPAQKIRLLCNMHKHDIEEESKHKDIKFSFIGTVPDGVEHTQSA